MKLNMTGRIILQAVGCSFAFSWQHKPGISRYHGISPWNQGTIIYVVQYGHFRDGYIINAQLSTKTLAIEQAQAYHTGQKSQNKVYTY